MIKSLELSKSNHKVIKNFCVKKKINFLSTPYDINSAKFLKKLGCKIFKTASADIVDLELHAYLAKTKKKVLISTGMSNLEEINQCVKIYKKYSNNNYVLLHCVSNYPCSLKSLNLKAISLIKERFKTKVGYSDHSNGNLAAVASVVLGASVVEKHFTINRGLPGPDQKASSTPNEFSKMVREIRKTELILGKKIKKCQKEELQMSKVSRKSLTLIKNIKKMQVLKRNYLKLKRPGTGIYFNKIDKLLGKKARKDFKKIIKLKKKIFINMEIYISTGGFRSDTAFEVVAKFIKNGIKNIELSGTKYSSENIAEISKLKDKVKLQIHNYFPPPKLPFVLNLASSDNKIYKKVLSI